MRYKVYVFSEEGLRPIKSRGGDAANLKLLWKEPSADPSLTANDMAVLASSFLTLPACHPIADDFWMNEN